jgi:hypothetical protein
VEELLKAEVYGKVPPVTDATVTKFITENRARLPRASDAELRLRVWDYLRSQGISQQRNAYVGSLRAATPVTAPPLRAVAPPRPSRAEAVREGSGARGVGVRRVPRQRPPGGGGRERPPGGDSPGRHRDAHLLRQRPDAGGSPGACGVREARGARTGREGCPLAEGHHGRRL